MAEHYHVCFAVPDLERAIADLTMAAGVQWCEPRADTLGEWDYRIVFSVGAPYIEIIQGSAGSPWDASDGPRFDHLGWWTHSLEVSKRRIADAGFPLEFDGCLYGRSFAYHRIDSIGARAEVVDAGVQAAFLRTWDPDGVPPAALECRRSS